LLVAGHGMVNELGIGQVQVCHSGFELFQALVHAEPLVPLLLLDNGGDAAVMVVVGRVDQIIVGQYK
jgi:hypothetical protein